LPTADCRLSVSRFEEAVPIGSRAVGNSRNGPTLRRSRPGYQWHVPEAAVRRYIAPMSTATSHAKFRCAQCEMLEDQCECDKYCVLCQSQLDIRICKDGLMYCEPCRTACDYKTSD
jgi:hypothetical protein